VHAVGGISILTTVKMYSSSYSSPKVESIQFACHTQRQTDSILTLLLLLLSQSLTETTIDSKKKKATQTKTSDDNRLEIKRFPKATNKYLRLRLGNRKKG